MTIHLSIVLFLPLAAGLVGRVPAARDGALGGARRARSRCSPTRSCCSPTSTPARGLQYVTDDKWIPELGIRYQLGIDGLNLFMVALTAIAWVPCTLVAAFREHDRPRLFFFYLALAETAVLGAFMAQDLALFIVFFDLMLVPFYFLIGGWGTRRPRARHHQVRDLHAGRLAADAGGGDRARRAVDARTAARSRSRSPCSSSARSREGTQEWIVLLFALAFFVKAPLFPLHGWVPETYRSTPIVGARAALRRALEGRRLRLPADRAADHARGRPALAGAVHRRRGVLDPVRLGPRLLAGQRAAGGRLLVDRPARLHRAGHLRPRGQGRPGRRVPDAQPRPRGGAAVPDHRRDRRAGRRQRVARASWAAWRSGRRCWPRCS